MDSIRALTDRQLKTWQQNPQLAGAQLFLVSSHLLDVEVSKVGDCPTPSKSELAAILQRAAGEHERPGFEVEVSGYRAHAYPLKQESLLQGLWLLFPAGPVVDWSALTRDSQRFSQELFALRQSGLGNPPTFRELVSSIPEHEESAQSTAPALHWERSRSRVTMTVEDELSNCLMVDLLPIF